MVEPISPPIIRTRGQADKMKTHAIVHIRVESPDAILTPEQERALCQALYTAAMETTTKVIKSADWVTPDTVVKVFTATPASE